MQKVKELVEKIDELIDVALEVNNCIILKGSEYGVSVLKVKGNKLQLLRFLEGRSLDDVVEKICELEVLP